MRIGHGYDIHALAPGRRCIVGGLEFENPTGPVGHSDGDVVLHALCDALLGACAAGDMGEWFGTDRPEWKDAPSRQFVEAVLERTRPVRVVNVDVTIVGARPRIAESRVRMRDLLAGLLGIPVSAVSVKASSGNGVGELGRGEAIAATVMVLVEEKSEDLGIPSCPGGAHEAAESRSVPGSAGGTARCPSGGTRGAGA